MLEDVLGGFVSYPLAALGALLIGLIESFSSFYSSAFKDAIVFATLIPVVLLRWLLTHTEVEEEEEELDDSAPLVSASPARGGRPADDDLIPTSPHGGLRATMTDDGEIVVDEVAEEEIPAVAEEEDEDVGYVLEEEDEDYKEEEEEDEGPLAHSTDDDY